MGFSLLNSARVRVHAYSSTALVLAEAFLFNRYGKEVEYCESRHKRIHFFAHICFANDVQNKREKIILKTEKKKWKKFTVVVSDEYNINISGFRGCSPPLVHNQRNIRYFRAISNRYSAPHVDKFLRPLIIYQNGIAFRL